MRLIRKFWNSVNSVSCVINARSLHHTSLRSFGFPVRLAMRFPMLQSAGSCLLTDGAPLQNGMEVSWHWSYKEMRHHWQISKWNTKGSQKSFKYRRDVKLNILPCYVIRPAKFQDKEIKRFDWLLKFSSSYCMQSSERKYPRRFYCFKTRRKKFLIR